MLKIQRIASRAVAQVLAGRSLTEQLESAWAAHRDLARGERGAVQDLCYGSLRHLGRLRAVLHQLAQKPVANPELQALLLVALYQLEYTQAASYAVVDHAVECAAQIEGERVRGFANAVLRNFQRNRDALLSRAEATDEGRYSHPDWWIRRLRRDFPGDAEAILRAGNGHPPMTLRVNRRRGTVEDCAGALAAAGIEARVLDGAALRLAQPVPVEQLPGFAQGRLSVQDAGAQAAAVLLDAKPGMRVLDACAAPGGKSAHILELADVHLTALDLDEVRLQRVRANLERLGLGAQLRCADAARPEQWWDGQPFDRVLLDAPCSASGVVRRHPDIKWLRRPADIARFARQQARLLEALWKVLAPGGTLLYATCSIFREENQEGIDRFLARQPGARSIGAMPGTGGLLLPNEAHDGFYYALLQKG
ncbi:MAG TPA: 16S rRNA (cytosine(967)-C(5))-methyltransferase RsmB [Burkholderiales bacterium]|nr:16S rRNA (cytosine(967)-C(5))-methyltransferase RsmB [Burkholderiales bacterium]